MESLNVETDTVPITAFCRAFVCCHAENWPPKEDTLAQEFVDWLGLKPFLSRDSLIELCLSKKVNLSFAELPPDLRGFNCSFENRTEIVIARRESVPGTDLHTLFHEFREVLENCFIELGYSTLDLNQEDELEIQAEVFAMSARIAVVTREIPAAVDIIRNADGKWTRCFGYSLMAVFGCIYLLSCVFLPKFEQIDSEVKRQRYVRM